VQPFAYVGQHGVIQEASGLLFMRARYYDTNAGRFLTRDPVRLSATSTQGPNAYLYVGNRPIDAVDPEGRAFHILGGALVGAGIAGVGSLGSAAISLFRTGDSGLTWQGLVGDVAGGAAEGACGAATMGVGLLSGGVCGAAGGMVASAATQGLEALSGRREEYDPGKMLRAIGAGGLFGTVSKFAGGLSGNATMEDATDLFLGWLSEPLTAQSSVMNEPNGFQGVAIITREQAEVRQPVSSTKKKPKRDAGR